MNVLEQFELIQWMLQNNIVSKCTEFKLQKKLSQVETNAP